MTDLSAEGAGASAVDPEQPGGQGAQLLGRIDEREHIDMLLDAAATGSSGTVVLSGPAGIGKSVLLDHAVTRAARFRILRMAGIQSETTFGYAGVHQLVGPLLNRVGTLPDPQRHALEAALGRIDDTEFDRFMVALAVMTLLSDLARDQPVLVIVDDAQWLDDESATAIAFVARRLQAERVAMLVAVRDGPDNRAKFERLPRLRLGGLDGRDAHALVARSAGELLDGAVGDQIVAVAGGNPLALAEVPKALTEAQLGGVVALPDPLPIGEHLSNVFTVRARALSAGAQTVLLLAAADQMGDPPLFRRAGSSMTGLEWDEASSEAEASGLVMFTPSVRFRHPLVRSAVYYAADPAQRRLVHAALATALDAAEDADRRAWHLGSATIEPDEQVARALEASAEHAQRRGGSSIAANYLLRAAELTPSQARATARLLEATRAEITAGQVRGAKEILARVTAQPRERREYADATWTQALIHLVEGRGRDAASVLADVLPLIDPSERHLATGASVAAVAATLSACHLLDATALHAVAHGVRELGARTDLPETITLLLDAFATRWTEGDAGCDALRAAVTSITHQRRELEETVGRHVAVVFYSVALAAAELLDDREWDHLAHTWVEISRRTGALISLPLALSSLSWLEVLQGRFRSATSHLAEIDELVSITGIRGLLGAPVPALVLRDAWQGNEEATRTGVRRMMRDAHDRGLGIGLDYGYAALTILELGAGRYDAALRVAERVADHDAIPVGALALADLVEAAVRAGQPERAPAALERLADRAARTGTAWARATLARSCAIAATGDEAEEHFTVALDELSKCSIVTDVARTQLAYGEWLRRARRKREARAALDGALELFERLGAAGFAARARAELAASGAHLRPRNAAPDVLTPQEAQIARLAADGERNSDIAAQLFITTSTVEYHLRKVFVKLGVSSRTQLARLDLPS
jgi:DNA-binding CsgD family transcriptional regulator